MHLVAHFPSQVASAANLPADSLPLPLKGSRSPLQNDDLDISVPGAKSLSADSNRSAPLQHLVIQNLEATFHWPLDFLISG